MRAASSCFVPRYQTMWKSCFSSPGPAGPNRMPSNGIETFQIVKWIAGPETGNQQIPGLSATNEKIENQLLLPVRRAAIQVRDSVEPPVVAGLHRAVA